MKSRLKSYKRKKLGLATVIVFCSLCFFVGFYGSTLLSQNVPRVKPRLRMLEMMENGNEEADLCLMVLLEKNLLNRFRFSSETFISASEESTGALDFVEKKIARATMIPRSHGESFNILRYELGQKYDSHYDVFNPAEYGPQSSQRIASFLLYLSDVEEGGETMFPFENGSNMGTGYDYQQCIGLKVKPRKGDGLLFYSVFPNGTIDQTSLHGSCPVTKGEKWVATKWIRDQVQEE